MPEFVWATRLRSISNASSMDDASIRDLSDPPGSRHVKWSVNGVLDEDDSLNWVPYLFSALDWFKLKVILVCNDTPNSSKLHLSDHNKRSEALRLASRGFEPIPRMYPGFILTCWHIGQGWRLSVMFFLVLWLCFWSPPPLTPNVEFVKTCK